MKRSSAVRKGKRYEDRVASIIHQRLLKEEEYRRTIKEYKDLIVKRDRDSGNRPDSYGDIFVPFSWFPYSIECKHHKDMNFNISQLLSGNISKLKKIYNDHEDYARSRGRIPVVVFRGNRTRDFVCIGRDYCNRLTKKVDINYICVDDLVIVLLDDFIRYFPMRASTRRGGG